MTFDEFESEFERLDGYFQGKLTEAQIEVYFDGLQKIPRVAFADIINKLRRHHRPIKSNFPTMDKIYELYNVWKKENPDKIERRYQVDDCPDCRSTGILHFRKFEADYTPEGMNIEYSALCANCKNWQWHLAVKDNGKPYLAIPMTTRQRLLDLGYDVYPKDYPELRQKEVYKTQREIKDQVPF